MCKILIAGDPKGSHSLKAIKKGWKPEDIVVWENDKRHAYAVRCIDVRINVILDDHTLSLLDSCTMKFDVIIGNPPYQAPDTDGSTYKPLWTKFWSKCFKLLKPGGTISLITPITWCAPTKDLDGEDKIDGMNRLWDIFSKYTTVADVTNIQAHFKGVNSTFGRVTVDTSGSEGLSFTNGFDSSLGFYPLGGEDRVAEELSNVDNIGSKYKMSGRIEPGWRVSLLKTRKINETNVEVCSDMQKPKTGAADTLYTHIHCDTQEEAEHIRKRILECEDVLYKYCRWHGFIDLKILSMIRV